MGRLQDELMALKMYHEVQWDRAWRVEQDLEFRLAVCVGLGFSF